MKVDYTTHLMTLIVLLVGIIDGGTLALIDIAPQVIKNVVMAINLTVFGIYLAAFVVPEKNFSWPLAILFLVGPAWLVWEVVTGIGPLAH